MVAIKINFKRRSDGEIVHSYKVKTLQTQFAGFIKRGFWTSDYYTDLSDEGASFKYFVGNSTRPVSTKSTDTLEKLGLNANVPVEIVENRKCTIQFKRRSDGEIVHSHTANTSQTQFVVLIKAFWTSEYFETLQAEGVLFEYFVGNSTKSVPTKSTATLEKLGLNANVPVEIVENRECTIQFKRRSDGEIVHSYKVSSLQTQFAGLIQYGFYGSEYFKTLRAEGVSFKYFIGDSVEPVLIASTDSLKKLGINANVPVEIVENRECTIEFKRRSDGEIVHSYTANSSQTQFNSLIKDFYQSEYSKTLRAEGVFFKYFIGNSVEPVLTTSTESIEKLGLENGSVVELVEHHQCVIHFKRRSDGEIVHSYTANSSQTQFKYLIQRGFYGSEYFKTLRAEGVSFKYFIGDSVKPVFTTSTESIEKLGLADENVVELELRFGWKYWKNRLPVFFNSYDEIRDIVNVENLSRSLFTFPAGHCNYLILDREILHILEILKQAGEINDYSKLFKCVRYSGISQRTTEKLVKRFDEHGFDKEKYMMIELVRWDQTKASEWGLINSVTCRSYLKQVAEFYDDGNPKDIIIGSEALKLVATTYNLYHHQKSTYYVYALIKESVIASSGDQLTFQKFLQSIFYVGKGCDTRVFQHLKDAYEDREFGPIQSLADTFLEPEEEDLNLYLDDPENNEEAEADIEIFEGDENMIALADDEDSTPEQKRAKIKAILKEWKHGYGIICLRITQHIVSAEAFTLEAIAIEGYGNVKHGGSLTNLVRGHYGHHSEEFGKWFTEEVDGVKKVEIAAAAYYQNAFEAFKHQRHRPIYAHDVKHMKI